MKLHTKLFIALVLGIGLGAALHSQNESAWLLTVNANLLRPIVAHAAYDYVAFLLIVREYRQGAARDSAAPPGDRPMEPATSESDESHRDS